MYDPVTPSTSAVSLLLALLSLTCWGSWSNFAKAAVNTPFPLFYADFCLGTLVTAAVIWVTLGASTLPQDGEESWGANVGYAFAAGAIFNVANVLLVAAIGMAGLAVAFPVGIGLALVLGTLLTYLIDSNGNDPIFLFSGVFAAFVAILFQVAADGMRVRDQAEIKTATKPLASADEELALKLVEQPKSRTYVLGVCAVSGLLMAMWAPLSALAEKKLTSYGTSLIFAMAVVCTAPFLCALLAKWPLIGAPCRLGEYFSLPLRQHTYGWLAGLVWAVGTIANLVSGDKVGLALSYAIGQAAPMVATLWGVLYYGEFEGASVRTMGLVVCCMATYAGAIALVAFSK